MPCALIVEDDPHDLVLLGDLLHSLGIKVSSAGTVSQAKAMLVERMMANPEKPFDIAFVDLKMIGSHGDGIEIIKVCREMAQRVPVVVATGAVNPDMIEDLWTLRYFSIASKPVYRDTLIIILDQHNIKHT